MKINPIKNNNSHPNFKGALNNKLLLSSLEKIADHGTTFVAGTTLAMSVGVRPFIISLTPEVSKENKKHAAANSIASGLTKFALVEAVALPVENALKNIDKNPTKFLTQNTISNLKKNSNTISSSQPYKVLSQFLKLSSGFITAIPKSMLTIAILPFIMDIIFPQKKSFKKQTNFNYNIKTKSPEIFKEFDKNISFKGNNSQFLTKNIAKIFNNKKIQDFIIKHNFKETNIARNMSIATDILLTTSYTHRTLFDKKIKKENKKPLIYSNIFSTAISLFGGYSIDKLVQKNTKNFIKKFTETNKNDPKLSKYIQGINILRPTLIFAIIYYGLLPLASTYFGEKFDKFISNKKN